MYIKADDLIKLMDCVDTFYFNASNEKDEVLLDLTRDLVTFIRSYLKYQTVVFEKELEDKQNEVRL